MPASYDEYQDSKSALTQKEKRLQLLNQRYDDEKVTLTEQEMWERDQQKKTAVKFGAKDKEGQKQYELLLDNQVDFVQT